MKIGFKATNKDMTCRDHKFEVGEWYEVKGNIFQCEINFCSFAKILRIINS